MARRRNQPGLASYTPDTRGPVPPTVEKSPMRDELRDLISTQIHSADCGCTDFRPDGSECDDGYYRRLADSVMELWPEVERAVIDCNHDRCRELRTGQRDGAEYLATGDRNE